MDFLREIVSGPKNRYQEDGFNLDLTYITPRVIAMAYPAEGIEKLYRNSIDVVSEFLNKNHNKKYQIINVSGRQINSDKLENIHSYLWQDHKTPQFQTLFIICQNMRDHLAKDSSNVCVVHCNHGKGRTGTLICCFMLFVQYFKTAIQAMKFYQNQRYKEEGYGVTQPCQIKYIEYFSEIVRRGKSLPSVVAISKIEIKGGHNLKDPYFKLLGIGKSYYYFNTKINQLQTLQILKQNQFIVKMKKSFYFTGDTILEIKHNPVVGKRVAITYAFNTAFLGSNLKAYEISLKQLSPLSAVKSGICEKDFKIILTFKKICGCSDSQEYEKRCNKCQPYLQSESQKWATIYYILDKRPKTRPQLLLFGPQQHHRSLQDQHQTDLA